LDVEYYHDLEMSVRGHSRSLKLVPFESLGALYYSPFLAESVAVCESVRYLVSKNGMTLKTRLKVVQGH